MHDLIGRQIGPYEIRDMIAEDGTAVVYRGYQPSLNRDVAIKVLRTFLAEDGEFVERFRREAMSAGGLRHPNILKIYDVGTFDGWHCIVMDYVSGGTLTKRFQAGPLPVDEAVDVAAQIADALDYAHKRGIVHRNLKPGNILIDEDGRPLLADFGIAHILTSEHRLTQPGSSRGALEYMSPEQCEGLPVDGRCDLYSLGIVLYQMLTGRAPFQDDTTMGMMYQILHQPPAPPSQLDATVPDWLESIILRALAKNPDDRFANGKEMAQALRERRVVPVPVSDWQGRTLVYASRLPAPGARTAPSEPASSRPSRKQRQGGRAAPVAILSVAVVALLGSAAYLGRDHIFPRRPQPAATEQLVQLDFPATEPPTSAPTPVQPTPTLAAPGDIVTATPQPEILAPSPTVTPLPTVTSSPTVTPSPTLAPSPTVTSSPTFDYQSIEEPTPGKEVASADAVTPEPTPGPVQPSPRPPRVTAAASTRPGVVLDFENFGAWRIGDQLYGHFEQVAERSHSGRYSARLSYDFPAVAQNYVVLLRQPSLPIIGRPTALGLWVYGDGSNHFLNAWVHDSQGEVRQFTFGQITHSGNWQVMTALLDTAAPWPQQNISGPDNGRLDYPVALDALVLDAAPDGGGPFKGAVFLDDLSSDEATGTPRPSAVPTSATPQPPRLTVTPPVAESGPLAGRIAFPQSREGRVDIMALDTADGGTWPVFTNGSQPDLRSDGRVVFNGIGGGKNNLIAANIGGGSETIMSNHPEDSYPSWSPTGRSVVFHSSIGGGQDHLYLLPDAARGQEPQHLQINAQDVLGRFPIWLGNWRIAYSGCGYQWGQGDWCGIWSINSDGSGGPLRLTEEANDHTTDALGGNLLFVRQNAGNWDIFIISENGGTARNLSQSPSQDFGGSFSPDGRQIAFMSDRDGWSIWVMGIDGSNPRKLLAVPGGFGSNWADERLSWGP